MNIKVFIIMLILFVSGVLTIKINECEAKCEPYTLRCLDKCAKPSDKQKQCLENCDRIKKECIQIKCQINN